MTTKSTTYRNFYKFSENVPETKHDGHAVDVLSTFVADPDDDPNNIMHELRCQLDGETFDAFDEELEDEDL